MKEMWVFFVVFLYFFCTYILCSSEIFKNKKEGNKNI